MKTSKPMKTSKQDIQDLLSQLAADIEEIKAMLNGAASACTVYTRTAGKIDANTISNDVSASNPATTDYGAIGNGVANANPDQTIAEVKRLLEPIAGICNKLPDRIKSYHSQLLLHIVRDLREELNRDNDTRKRKGLPTIENKIDNALTLLSSLFDKFNQLAKVIQPSSNQQGQAAHKKSAKSGIISVIKSALSGVQRLRSKRKSRWYRNPYILCAIVIYLLYFGLSIFGWTQWHHYRDENARLRLTADKYHVDSIILREVYPQAAITLSAYEHIAETEGADTAIEAFRKNRNELKSNHKPKKF